MVMQALCLMIGLLCFLTHLLPSRALETSFNVSQKKFVNRLNSLA